MLDKIMNINLKENKTIVFVVIVLVITLFLSKKIWDSQDVKLNYAKSQINDYNQRINLADEINVISDQLKKFDNSGWPSKESVAVMGKITDLATKNNLQIDNFDPQGLTDKGEYYIIPFTLSFKAEYFNLQRFLSDIENLSYLTKIKNIRIVPESVGYDQSDDNPVSLATNLAIEAYVLKK